MSDAAGLVPTGDSTGAGGPRAPRLLPAAAGDARYDDLVAAWLAGRAPTTHAAYSADLRDLQRFLGAQDWQQVGVALFERGAGEANRLAMAWIADMRERELADATVARRLAAMKSLAKIARLQGRIAWAIEVDPPKVETLLDTRGPEREGVTAMLAILARTPGHRAARNLAILRLLWDVALRRNEAVTLDLEHFDPKRRRILVLRKGKTKRRPRTIPATSVAAIEAWLEFRGRAPGPLFLAMNPSGVGREDRLTGRSVARIMNDLGLRAGLGRVRPHGVRHSSITEAARRTNGDSIAICAHSGHADFNVAARYIHNQRDLAGDVSELVSEGVGSPAAPKPAPPGSS